MAGGHVKFEIFRLFIKVSLYRHVPVVSLYEEEEKFVNKTTHRKSTEINKIMNSDLFSKLNEYLLAEQETREKIRTIVR